MTTGMVSVDNCPRDLEGILSIQRGIRYRLGIQTHMFKNEAEEQAFLGATDHVQAESLLAHLQQFDTGAVQQTAAVQPPATQIALPPAQQNPVAPTIATTAMQMPAGPQMPAVVPPPAAPQAPPMAAPHMAAPHMAAPPMAAPPQAPVVPPPTAPVAPLQVQMPAMPAPPQAAQAPAAPPQVPVTPTAQAAPPQAPAAAPAATNQKSGKKPSTTSDPTNAGAIQVDPKAAQFQAALAKAIKEIGGVLDAHSDYFDELYEQQAGMTRVLTTILAVQLALAEQAGIDRSMLAKCIKAMGEDAPADFLKEFAGVEEDTE